VPSSRTSHTNEPEDGSNGFWPAVAHATVGLPIAGGACAIAAAIAWSRVKAPGARVGGDAAQPVPYVHGELSQIEIATSAPTATIATLDTATTAMSEYLRGARRAGSESEVGGSTAANAARMRAASASSSIVLTRNRSRIAVRFQSGTAARERPAQMNPDCARRDAEECRGLSGIEAEHDPQGDRLPLT
jgi:hypothetical protein